MNEVSIFTFALVCYLIAFLSYSFSMGLDKEKPYKFARIAMIVGIISAFIALLIRWKAAGHPPLSNMYESMATLSTFLALVTIVFTRKKPLVLGEAFSSVGAIFMIGIASVFETDVRPLIPALQSYWLHLHVSLAFVGEAFYALAFILGYLYCFRALMNTSDNSDLSSNEKFACKTVVFGLPIAFILGMGLLTANLKNSEKYHDYWLNVLLFVIIPSCLSVLLLVVFAYRHRGALGEKTEKWLPDLDTLDHLTYRAIALGFPLFTVGGLIFGMVWANKAWGRYWGWDPKETWSLITFFVYSIYLHVRLTRGWKGVWTASLAMLGFLVTMFTLFGVNLLISSLHSYSG